jgi:hypothetical protein
MTAILNTIDADGGAVPDGLAHVYSAVEDAWHEHQAAA